MPRGVYPRKESRSVGRSVGRSVYRPVSRIDWPAMIAQLEQERAALDEQRADVDAVIDVVRRRAGPAATIAAIQQIQRAPAHQDGKRAAKAKPTPKGKPARNGGPTGKRQDNISASQIARIRRGWEAGEPATAIAKAAKVSDVTVRNRAKAGGWQRPKKAPQGVQLSGSTRCTSCDVMTSTDPCEHCGSKLKRKGW